MMTLNPREVRSKAGLIDSEKPRLKQCFFSSSPHVCENLGGESAGGGKGVGFFVRQRENSDAHQETGKSNCKVFCVFLAKRVWGIAC